MAKGAVTNIGANWRKLARFYAKSRQNGMAMPVIKALAAVQNQRSVVQQVDFHGLRLPIHVLTCGIHLLQQSFQVSRRGRLRTNLPYPSTKTGQQLTMMGRPRINLQHPRTTVRHPHTTFRLIRPGTPPLRTTTKRARITTRRPRATASFRGPTQPHPRTT